MAKFILRTQKKSGFANLSVRVNKRNPKLDFKIGTSLQVDIETWEKANKNISSWNKFAAGQGKELCDKMNQINEIIETLISDGKIQSNSDKDIIEKHISFVSSREANTVTEQYKKSIVNYTEYLIDGIKSGKIRHHGGLKYSLQSIRNFEYLGKHLKGFISEDTIFSDIDSAFADRFRFYLEAKGLMRNSVNTIISTMLTICNRAAQEGINQNAVSLKIWKTHKADNKTSYPRIYLNDDEINALYNMKLTRTRDKVRDVFLLGCLSCQRFSDYDALSKKNFKLTDGGTPVIALTQKKTGTYIEVPILDNRINEIAMKYGYNIPTVNYGTMLFYLKKIFYELSETQPSLKEPIKTPVSAIDLRFEKKIIDIARKFKEGKELNVVEHSEYHKYKIFFHDLDNLIYFNRDLQGDVYKPKWQLVGTHTARRSGITNLYKTGIFNNREIMSMSGHKTEQIFEHYISMGTSEQADRIAAKVAKLKELKNKNNKKSNA